MRSKRIILDTNLWISFLISDNFTELESLINSKEIILIFSNELLEEFIEVAQRPKFKRFFSNKDIEDLLNVFDQYGELIEVSSDVNVCRDEKDNFLLNLSIDGKVDFLVSGDQDLLVLKNIEQTKILTYRELINELSIKK